jgi:O-antigen/teichoic acid export membrane protein
VDGDPDVAWSHGGPLVTQAVLTWIRANRVLVENAGSLVGTTIVTSGFGFLYWLAAARFFSPAVVGVASAAVSAMMLLSALGMLGLGTFLIGELPRRPERAGPVIVAAGAAAAAAAALLAVLFALVAPLVVAELQPIGHTADALLLFAAGAAVTALALTLDQAFVGLLRGPLQLWRNGVFAAAKLVAVLLAGAWLAWDSGLAIYGTWLLGHLVSLLAVALFLRARGHTLLHRPHWGFLRSAGGPAMAHHVLNLAFQAPTLLLPLVVTGLLSAAWNASYYAAWMIASFAFVPSTALATVLFAAGASDRSALPTKLRRSLEHSLLTSATCVIALVAAAGPVLTVFGARYAGQAELPLRILTLGAFPFVLKVHYASLCRLRGRVVWATRLMLAAAVLETASAAAGALVGGLPGLCLGWVLAMSVEAAFLARPLWSACAPSDMHLDGHSPDAVPRSSTAAHASSPRDSSRWQLV